MMVEAVSLVTVVAALVTVVSVVRLVKTAVLGSGIRCMPDTCTGRSSRRGCLDTTRSIAQFGHQAGMNLNKPLGAGAAALEVEEAAVVADAPGEFVGMGVYLEPRQARQAMAEACQAAAETE